MTERESEREREGRMREDSDNGNRGEVGRRTVEGRRGGKMMVVRQEGSIYHRPRSDHRWRQLKPAVLCDA